MGAMTDTATKFDQILRCPEERVNEGGRESCVPTVCEKYFGEAGRRLGKERGNGRWKGESPHNSAEADAFREANLLNEQTRLGCTEKSERFESRKLKGRFVEDGEHVTVGLECDRKVTDAGRDFSQEIERLARQSVLVLHTRSHQVLSGANDELQRHLLCQMKEIRDLLGICQRGESPALN
jgi:hypothetical protein